MSVNRYQEAHAVFSQLLEDSREIQNSFDKVPSDIHIAIFSYLTPKGILTCSLVNKRWYLVSNAEIVWKLLFLRFFKPCSCLHTSWKEGFKMHLDRSHCMLTHKPKVIDLHHKDIVRGVQLIDDIVISGSLDQTIRTWNLHTGIPSKVIECKVRIFCLQVKDYFIVTGSSGNQVRIWDLDSGACLNVLQGHSDVVSCVAIKNDKVISGSYDSTLKMWNLLNGRCLKTVSGHLGQITDLKITKDTIVSCSYSTIMTWDLLTEQVFVYPCQGTDLRLQLLSTQIIVGFNHDIHLLDLKSLISHGVLKGHTSKITCLCVHESLIISGSTDCTIRLWDTEKRNCLKTFYTEDPIYCLDVRNNTIVAGQSNGSIRIFHFS